MSVRLKWAWARNSNVRFLRGVLSNIKRFEGFFPEDVDVKIHLAREFIEDALRTQAKYNTYEKFQKAKKEDKKKWMKEF